MGRGEQADVTVAKEQLNDVTVALEALTVALDDGGELDGALQLVCDQVIQVLPEADMASVTLVRDGAAETAAFTERLVVDIDIDQYRIGAGPCLHAAASGEIVRVQVDTAHERWPEFARSALGAGVASYLSAPLMIDAQHAGALNIYSRSAHGFREVDSALIGLYVSAVKAALRATSRYLTARERASQLSTALVSRAVIDQAKGIVMAVHAVSAEEAFQLLVRQSQRENVKLHDLAEQLVARIARTGR
jgi:GAF domain-containing protein